MKNKEEVKLWDDGVVVHEVETAPCPAGGDLAWAKCANNPNFKRPNMKAGSLDAPHYSKGNINEITCVYCKALRNLR